MLEKSTLPLSLIPHEVHPVVRELPGDLETPVSLFLKLSGRGPAFLLESVTGGEQVARYSFLGVNLQRAYILRDQALEQVGPEGSQSLPIPPGSDPLEALRAVMSSRINSPQPGLPRFSGGLVGFMGYEIARHFEPSLELPLRPDSLDAIFLQADTLVAFDHAYGRVLLIAIARTDADNSGSVKAAEERLDDLEKRLKMPLIHPEYTAPRERIPEMESSLSQSDFMAAVQEAQEHIAAGDIFQVVLSQRLTRATDAHPFTIYRALRRLNPSPYMFYFDFANLGGGHPLRLIGASPEMHVRLEGDQAAVRPIAGTRRRGSNRTEDQALEIQLRSDPKELAEHVMLVDLARNDLGRVCEYGSVEVTERMVVERYSHVMHLVSHVQGRLRPHLDAFDLMRATFPAGTVSGAPKVRAMQIIAELEDQPRGPYAGAVGYFSYEGSMDTCLTIRTLIMEGQQVSVQAGAGIVADSDPRREHQETVNKARALAQAIEMAERVESP